MNELLILFNFICASSPLSIDQAACTKVLEAYSSQTGMSKIYTDSRSIVINKAEKTIKINPTVATLIYTGGRYTLTKRVAVTLPFFKNTAISIKGSNKGSDQSGNIGVSLHF